MFRRLIALAAVLVAAAMPLAASAQAEGPWLIRLRGLWMSPTNGNDPEISLGKVEADDKLFPEVDFTYFFAPNIAAELVLTYPQKHDITLGGTKVGSIKQIPPTLLLQYHFMPTAEFRPYVGAGLNYTKFSDEQLPAGVTIDGSSFGPAIQGGFDYKLAPQWFLNVDLKYVWISTDTNDPVGKILTLDIDPWLFSVGIGYRF
jgi:outer membrane protein